MIKTSIQNRASYITYTKVIKSIETYLDKNHFLKLDLPVMLPSLIPESYLEVFETEYRYMDTRQKLYLTPSPELLVKRLLVDGIGDCYYLGKSYRNSEPASSKHLGEFTMLELYKVGADYMDISEVVLEMLQSIHHSTSKHVIPAHAGIQSDKSQIPGLARNDKVLTYQGIKVDLSQWEKMTVAEAFQKYAGITEAELFDHEMFRDAAKRKQYAINDPITKHQFGYEDLWSQIYSNEVEPHLGKNGYPTLLYDYPVEFAALSKPNSDGKTAQRFEFYIAGIELGNCYSELTEWPLQEERLRKEQQERAKSGKISHPTDWGFIESLKKGLPECSGIAIGVDRLAMIFADVDTIEKLKLISIKE